jgi:DNA-binding NtrC family response regulator
MRADMARILVIDDEVVMLGLISSTLRQDGHIITETSDPIDALSIVDQYRQEIDLVLTDVETKPISGFEFVKRITQRGIDIPVLFMSDYPSLAEVISSTLGKGAVIEKPFTASDLRRSVARFLARRNRRSTANRESNSDPKAA